MATEEQQVIRVTPTPHHTLDLHDALVYTERGRVPDSPFTPQNQPVLGYFIARPPPGVTGRRSSNLIWLGHGQGWSMLGDTSKSIIQRWLACFLKR